MRNFTYVLQRTLGSPFVLGPINYYCFNSRGACLGFFSLFCYSEWQSLANMTPMDSTTVYYRNAFSVYLGTGPLIGWVIADKWWCCPLHIRYSLIKAATTMGHSWVGKGWNCDSPPWTSPLFPLTLPAPGHFGNHNLCMVPFHSCVQPQLVGRFSITSSALHSSWVG